jgi:hypothetical protein
MQKWIEELMYVSKYIKPLRHSGYCINPSFQCRETLYFATRRYLWVSHNSHYKYRLCPKEH